MERRRRVNNNGPSPILIGLLIQIFQQLDKLPVKPMVTIALLAFNIAPRILPNANVFGFYLDDISENCIHPQKIVLSLLRHKKLLLNRLVLSGFIHVDDMHLYYNMVKSKSCLLL